MNSRSPKENQEIKEQSKSLRLKLNNLKSDKHISKVCQDLSCYRGKKKT